MLYLFQIIVILLSLFQSYAKLKKMIFLTQTSQIKKLDRLVKIMHSENEKILCEVSEKVTRLSAEFVQVTDILNDIF